ncbi:5'-nucleotidase C-terminal domain-containing protein, partial [Acinetobacter baumannii]|nr:5'-nucleotidase C-terminal domain-containing protein [Acinetobacter baumannii]
MSKKGTKIGLIGLTAPINLTYEPFGWHTLDPVDYLAKIIPELSKETDVIVILSHLGLPEDKIIAETFPEVDIIIESHTHHLFEEGLTWNGCLLAAAGRFGEYSGEIEITIQDKKIINKKAKTTKTADLEEKDSDIEEIENYKLEGEILLQNQKVGVLQETLIRDSSLMSMTLEAIKKYAEVEVALLNTGIILKDLLKGEVTGKDLHECLPHPMNLIRVTLKGRDVKRLVYEIEKNTPFLHRFQIVGMKFRGKFFGEICYDGLAYCKETKRVTWCGNDIDEDQEYILATVDHLS